MKTSITMILYAIKRHIHDFFLSFSTNNNDDNLRNLQHFLEKHNKTFNDSFLGNIVTNNILGQGGNGIVYSGKLQNDKIDRQPFAIKFLTNTGKRKETRFIDEYLNPQMANLQHSICGIQAGTLKIGKNLIIPYIIMKREEISLDAWITKDGNRTNESIHRITNTLLSAIQEIHERKIIHRDLKPQNILLDDNNNLYIADFGIAAYNEALYYNAHRTRKGERLGNREFSAPEQEHSCPPHETMDIYAFGQIIHYLNNGEVYRDSASVNLQITPELNDIVSRCLHQNPQHRPQNTSSLFSLINQDKMSTISSFQETAYNAVRQTIAFRKLCSYLAPDLYSILRISESSMLKHLFMNLQSNSISTSLWAVWESGSSENVFTKDIDISIFPFVKIGTLTRKISSAWIYRDLSCSQCDNDFILIEYDKFELPNGMDEEYYYKGNLIPHTHVTNGYTIGKDGEREEIDYEQIKSVLYDNEKGIVILASNWGCFANVRGLYEWINEFDKLCHSNNYLKEEDVIRLATLFRKHHFREVMYTA